MSEPNTARLTEALSLRDLCETMSRLSAAFVHADPPFGADRGIATVDVCRSLAGESGNACAVVRLQLLCVIDALERHGRLERADLAGIGHSLGFWNLRIREAYARGLMVTAADSEPYCELVLLDERRRSLPSDRRTGRSMPGKRESMDLERRELLARRRELLARHAFLARLRVPDTTEGWLRAAAAVAPPEDRALLLPTEPDNSSLVAHYVAIFFGAEEYTIDAVLGSSRAVIALAVRTLRVLLLPFAHESAEALELDGALGKHLDTVLEGTAETGIPSRRR